MKVFKHKLSGEFLRLIKLRESNVNTYFQVDEFNNIIIKKRDWSIHPEAQKKIIVGFKNLQLID